MWSDLIYTPSFLTTLWSTETLFHFEIISDANPDYAAVTYWCNNEFIARSVHFSPPDVHSFEFELHGFANAITQFSPKLLQHAAPSLAVTLWCDDQVTCRHLNCGARQFDQNQDAFSIIHFLATHQIRFIARWKHRSTSQITEVDTSGHLPTVKHFLSN